MLIDASGANIVATKPWKKGLEFLNELSLEDAKSTAEHILCLALKQEFAKHKFTDVKDVVLMSQISKAATINVINRFVESGCATGYNPCTGKITIASGVEIDAPIVMSNGEGLVMFVPNDEHSLDQADSA